MRYIIKQISNIFQCLKYIYFNTKKRDFLKTERNVFIDFLILGILGLVRLYLHIILGLSHDHKWYSPDFDIILIMFFWPAIIVFFTVFLLGNGAKLLHIKFDVRKTYNLLFYMSFLHLIVPFGDFINFHFNIPWRFPLSALIDTSFLGIFQKYFVLFLPIGIAIFLITMIIGLYKLFKREFKMKSKYIGILFLILFIFIYLPGENYFVWTTLNQLFINIFSINANGADNYLGSIILTIIYFVCGFLYIYFNEHKIYNKRRGKFWKNL